MRLPCLRSGRSKRIVCQVFERICEVNAALTLELPTEQDGLPIYPGVYTLTASNGQVVERTWTEHEVVPKGPLKRSIRDEDIPDITRRAILVGRRQSSFRQLLMTRDSGRCVISGDTEDLEAAHIVACAYMQQYENRILRVKPQSLVALLSEDPHYVNTAKNGAMMTKGHAASFDEGELAFSLMKTTNSKSSQ